MKAILEVIVAIGIFLACLVLVGSCAPDAQAEEPCLPRFDDLGSQFPPERPMTVTEAKFHLQMHSLTLKVKSGKPIDWDHETKMIRLARANMQAEDERREAAKKETRND